MNMQWWITLLFSGIGTSVLGWLIFKNISKKTTIKQKQHSGDNSTNIQVGQIKKNE